MPTVSVPKDELLRRLGGNLTLEQLDEMCFCFGLEYEECLIDEKGVEVVKIEIPANRYDLLCLEGLVTALLAYNSGVRQPDIRYANPTPRETAYVQALPEATFTRPYIFAACLRGVKLTQQIYDSLLDLQSKLHQNLCRKRTLAAIGTHDMDRIVEPLVYRLERPEEILFAPLSDSSREFTAAELMRHYSETNSHLKPYLKILEGRGLYPVLRDATGKVCSWPPITNSDATKVTLDTRNIFIEVTATDRVKGSICLNMLVHCFSQYCEEPFTVEPFYTKYDDGTVLSPDLTERTMVGELGYFRSLVGIPKLSGEEVCALLKRMMVKASYHPDKEAIEAQIPICRPDIQHACDIGEDIAIAYGYNQIAKESFPKGCLRSMTYMSRSVRDVLASCGYKETLMPILDSLTNMYHRMGWKQPSEGSLRSPVLIKNAKVSDLEACRVSLLPGILTTIANLKATTLPIQVFEVGDVVWQSVDSDVQAVNNRNVACGYANCSTAGLEEVQGVSETVLNELGFYSEYQRWELGESKIPIPDRWKHLYRLEPLEDNLFMPSRGVKLVSSSDSGVTLGVMGVVHPDVLRRFHIQLPAMGSRVFELRLCNETSIVLHRHSHIIKHGSWTSWLPERVFPGTEITISCVFNRTFNGLRFMLNYGVVLNRVRYLLHIKLERSGGEEVLSQVFVPEGDLERMSHGRTLSADGTCPVIFKVHHDVLDNSAGDRFCKSFRTRVQETSDGSLYIKGLKDCLEELLKRRGEISNRPFATGGLEAFEAYESLPDDFTWTMSTNEWLPRLRKSNRSILIRIVNLCGKHLKLDLSATGTVLEEGQWVEYPSEDIAPYCVSEFGARGAGFFGGTSGRCSYGILGESGTLTFSWEQPSIGSMGASGVDSNGKFCISKHVETLNAATLVFHVYDISHPSIDIWAAKAISPSVPSKMLDLTTLPTDSRWCHVFDRIAKLTPPASKKQDASSHMVVDVLQELLQYHWNGADTNDFSPSHGRADSIHGSEPEEPTDGGANVGEEFYLKSPRSFFKFAIVNKRRISSRLHEDFLLYLDWGIGNERFCKVFTPDERIHLRGTVPSGIEKKRLLFQCRTMHFRCDRAEIQKEDTHQVAISSRDRKARPFLQELSQNERMEYVLLIFHSLCEGLQPYVTKRMVRKYGSGWLDHVRIPVGHVWHSEDNVRIDVEGMMYLITAYWLDLFDDLCDGDSTTIQTIQTAAIYWANQELYRFDSVYGIQLFVQRVLASKYLQDAQVDSLVRAISRGTGHDFGTKNAFVQHVNSALSELGYMLVRVSVEGRHYYSLKDLESVSHPSDAPFGSSQDVVTADDLSGNLAPSSTSHGPSLFNRTFDCLFSPSEVAVYMDAMSHIIQERSPLPLLSGTRGAKTWSSLCSSHQITDTSSHRSLAERFEAEGWLNIDVANLSISPGVRFHVEFIDNMDLSHHPECVYCRGKIISTTVSTGWTCVVPTMEFDHVEHTLVQFLHGDEASRLVSRVKYCGDMILFGKSTASAQKTTTDGYSSSASAEDNEEHTIFVSEVDSICSGVNDLAMSISSKGSSASVSSNDEDRPALIDSLAMVTLQLESLIHQYMHNPTLMLSHVESLVLDPFDVLYRFIQLPRERWSSILSSGPSDSQRPALLAIEHICFHIYNVSKVVGVRRVTAYAPNEVRLLVPVTVIMEFLKSNNRVGTDVKHENKRWCMEYVFLSWLSLLIYTPFELCTIWLDDTGSGLTLERRIIAVAIHYLTASAKARDAAATLLSTLYGRPDIRDTELRDFLVYCNWILSPVDTKVEPRRSKKGVKSREDANDSPNSSDTQVTGCNTASTREMESSDTVDESDLFNEAGDYPAQNELNLDTLDADSQAAVGFANAHTIPLVRNEHTQIGILTILKQMLKHMSRLIIEPHLSQFAKCLLNNNNNSTACRKLKAGCIGRLASHLLPPQATTNRYRRKCRKLVNTEPVTLEPEEETTDFVMDTRVESIVEQLLSSLLDADIRVRWASAKSIGRISAKLPMYLNDQIIEYVIQVIQNQYDLSQGCFTKGEAIVHGCCLAIAEIIRGGILHPHMLDKVLDSVVLTLDFDVWRGKGSAGTSVRDASCYICWAIVRNYSGNYIQPTHLIPMSKSLVNMALFDISINCRRAACAALQEMVGRVGNVAHGLEIIVLADYFTVSNRRHAFINVSYTISKLGFYTISMIDNLIKTKLHHPDITTRCYAATALGRISLALINSPNSQVITRNGQPVYLEVVSHCLQTVTSNNLGYMHGSLCALSQILLGLLKYGDLISGPFDSIKQIPVIFEIQRLFRLKGSAIIRQSVCDLIKAICLIILSTEGLSLAEDEIACYITIIKDSIRSFTLEVQIAAVECLVHLYNVVCVDHYEEADKLLNYFITSLENKNDHLAARRGYALAFSGTPKNLCRQYYEPLLCLLCNEIISNSKDGKIRDAQTRQHSMMSLIHLLEMCIDEPISLEATELLLQTLETSSLDLEVDSRGDVGSWVREVTIEVISYILYIKHCSVENRVIYGLLQHMDQNNILRLVNGLLTVCLETLDHTRARAIFLFAHLFGGSFHFKVEWVWKRVFYGTKYEYEIARYGTFPVTPMDTSSALEHSTKCMGPSKPSKFRCDSIATSTIPEDRAVYRCMPPSRSGSSQMSFEASSIPKVSQDGDISMSHTLPDGSSLSISKLSSKGSQVSNSQMSSLSSGSMTSGSPLSHMSSLDSSTSMSQVTSDGSAISISQMSQEGSTAVPSTPKKEKKSKSREGGDKIRRSKSSKYNRKKQSDHGPCRHERYLEQCHIMSSAEAPVLSAIAHNINWHIVHAFDLQHLLLSLSSDSMESTDTRARSCANLSLRLPGYSLSPLTFEQFLPLIYLPRCSFILVRALVHSLGGMSIQQTWKEKSLDTIVLDFLRNHLNDVVQAENGNWMELHEMILHYILRLYRSLIQPRNSKLCFRVVSTARHFLTHGIIEADYDLVEILSSESTSAKNYHYLKAIFKCLHTIQESSSDENVARGAIGAMLGFISHPYPTLSGYAYGHLLPLLSSCDWSAVSMPMSSVLSMLEDCIDAEVSSRPFLIERIKSLLNL
ncbi:beta-tubulin cofactor [Babesia ovis]|uniref:phenylalanine--tRNA ligase n=1 Tax=Babesia ovis TaxID=5869 RepID=A0A9W5T8X4_BABOV|nr:beta-tubulin cofactor [Babesia ovis]